MHKIDWKTMEHEHEGGLNIHHRKKEGRVEHDEWLKGEVKL